MAKASKQEKAVIIAEQKARTKKSIVQAALPKSMTSSTNVQVVLHALEKEAKPLKKAISDLAIKSNGDFDTAAQLLKALKDKAKAAEAEEKKITDPLKQAMSAAKSHFKPFYDAIYALETDTKLKMGIWLEHQKKEALKLDEALESGAIKKASTFLRKREDLVVTSTSAKIRTLQKLEIFNARLIPAEFLIPDEKAIENALKDGREVPGCRLVAVNNIAI